MTFAVLTIVDPNAIAFYERFGLKHAKALEGVIFNSFATVHEAGAFSDAVVHAFGKSCNIKEVKADSKTSQIAFFNQDSESGSDYTRIRHSSPAVRIAYEMGIKVGERRMGRIKLCGDVALKYEQAVAELAKAGLENTPENLIPLIS